MSGWSTGLREREAPHGSPAGHDQGCRTPLACPNHGSSELLTCAEAAIRRRGDFSLQRLPPDQQVYVVRDLDDHGRRIAREEPNEVHGSAWGYQRGCRDRRSCPNWALDRVTCHDARRRYIADYQRRRTGGEGSRIPHGTLAGYSAGCRDEQRCDRSADGLTCSEMRRRYKMRIAREAGVQPLVFADDPAPAVALVRRWSEAGHSIRDIARRTGVGRTTIAALTMHGQPGSRRRCSRSTVERILAAGEVPR